MRLEAMCCIRSFIRMASTNSAFAAFLLAQAIMRSNGTAWEKDILEAYALYFVKFVKAYEEEGITIHQIHVQNEVAADQNFPSCVWTGEQLREFIRDYLGPAFEKHGLNTEIWLGTINAPEAWDEFERTPTSASGEVNQRSPEYAHKMYFPSSFFSGIIKKNIHSYFLVRRR
ncbi:hypothetical protein PAAL109150_17075 [Paenibacillus alkaliterrae]